jgi:hypothetical protein
MKDFILFEEALELKQLGFDEPCFTVYNNSNLVNWWEDAEPVNNSQIVEGFITAPTYSQAFRWFREKYDLFISIFHYENGYSINDLRRFDTYEEAELACLKKLIEIVKENAN